MKKKVICIIVLLIIISGVVISFVFNQYNDNIFDDKFTGSNTSDLNKPSDLIIDTQDRYEDEPTTAQVFNKKLVYNFGFGSAFEIDIPKMKNSFENIVIRNNQILIYTNDDYISISKNV